MTKYIIQIGENQLYPFDGPKDIYSSVVVRKKIIFTSPQQQAQILSNLAVFMKLNHPHVVKISRVLERRGKELILDYQYVQENLTKYHKLQDNQFLVALKDSLVHHCQNIAEKGIKTVLRVEDIGVNNQGELKVFINFDFELIAEDRENLAQQYLTQIDKLIEQQGGSRLSKKAPSELSDYSYRLDKKITEIEDRLNRRKRRRKSKGSSPQRSGSDKNKEVKAQVHQIDGLSSKHSNGSITSQRTRYSTIEMNQMIKPKIHRASFNDFTTTSYKLNQSSRQDSLKKRFEKALEKTQEAFKSYQCQFKRNRRF